MSVFTIIALIGIGFGIPLIGPPLVWAFVLLSIEREPELRLLPVLVCKLAALYFVLCSLLLVIGEAIE